MPFLSREAQGQTAAFPSASRPVKTNYTSNAVEIPTDFLAPRPLPPSGTHHRRITVSKIDFAAAGLPEYAAASAWLLENVLTGPECAALLALADASAPAHPSGDRWRPAMVNAGGNYEILAAEYRNSDRIVWDQREVMGRVMERCFEAEGLREALREVKGNESCLGKRAARVGERWVFTRPNERMRFLRYREGGFFQRHCDGSYESIRKPGEEGGYERSLFTLHLYLSSGEGLKGGSTAFFAGREEEKRMDVEARMGRVLIFQHRGLLHSGETVVGGEKFTMRTDLMYRLVEDGEVTGQ